MAADPTPPTLEPVVARGPRTMLELGARLGADVWWLEQLFSVAGRWAPDTSRAGVRTHLAELSRVAGDHAVALRALLPRPAPVDPAGWVRPPSPAVADILASLPTPSTPTASLAMLHRVVVPRLLVGWDARRGPSADGVRRALRHARADLAELRDEGEALLHALMVDEHTVGSAHSAALMLEGELVAGGGIHSTGPPALPA